MGTTYSKRRKRHNRIRKSLKKQGFRAGTMGWFKSGRDNQKNRI